MIAIRALTKTVHASTGDIRLYRQFNLSVQKGSFVAIVGNNGTGKTTLLNLIAGIDTLDSGTVRIHDKPPGDVRVGYVFQNYREALYPWMSVMENITLPLRLRGVPKHKRYEIARTFCSTHGLRINFDAYPYSLSGGQQQQISVVRSWIDQPDLILMDEPFSSLDYYMSFRFQKEIAQLWSEFKTTILFVSHRIDEAIYLSDRIVILGGQPVRILDDFKNPIGFPRSVNTLSSDECNRLRKRILEQLEKC